MAFLRFWMEPHKVAFKLGLQSRVHPPLLLGQINSTAIRYVIFQNYGNLYCPSLSLAPPVLKCPFPRLNMTPPPVFPGSYERSCHQFCTPCGPPPRSFLHSLPWAPTGLGTQRLTMHFSLKEFSSLLMSPLNVCKLLHFCVFST